MYNNDIYVSFKKYMHFIVLFQSDYGDVSQRLEIKKKCHDFEWYLKNVYPERLIPINHRQFGRVKKYFFISYKIFRGNCNNKMVKFCKKYILFTNCYRYIMPRLCNALRRVSKAPTQWKSIMFSQSKCLSVNIHQVIK
jgi:hypothetical protein